MLPLKNLLEIFFISLVVRVCHGKAPKGDTVPFMLLVEHQSGYRCAGALVSLRVAVTSASCARMRNGAITVLTGAYLTGVLTEKDGVRRIKSIVLPVGYRQSMDFDGSVNDVAVMKLEKPFANGLKIIRPILMEKEQTTYEREGAMCNLVRIIQAPLRHRRDEDRNDHDNVAEANKTMKNLNFSSSSDWLTEDVGDGNDFNKNEEVNGTAHDGKRNVESLSFEYAGSNNSSRESKDNSDHVRKIKKRAIDEGKHATIFRIFDVTVVNSERCRDDNMVVGNHYWTLLSKQVVCTKGAPFCQSDWGTGLVCEGKLCGLLSRVAHTAGQVLATGCGTTHTLQSLGRWKRFLDCAHDSGRCQQLPCSKTCEDIPLELDSKYSDSSEEGNKKDSESNERTSTPKKMKTTESTKKVKATTKKTTSVSFIMRKTVARNQNNILETDVERISSSESDDSGMGIELEKKSKEKGKKGRVKSEEESDKSNNDNNDSDLSDAGEPKTSASETSEESESDGSGANLLIESEEKARPTKKTTKIVTEKPKTSLSHVLPTRTKKPLSSSSSPNHLIDFEPYRADFKIGDYDDTAADYRGGSGFDEGEESSRGKVSTTSTSSPTSTSSTSSTTSTTSTTSATTKSKSEILTAELTSTSLPTEGSMPSADVLTPVFADESIFPDVKMVHSGTIVLTTGSVLGISFVSVLYHLQRS